MCPEVACATVPRYVIKPPVAWQCFLPEGSRVAFYSGPGSTTSTMRVRGHSGASRPLQVRFDLGGKGDGSGATTTNPPETDGRAISARVLASIQ